MKTVELLLTRTNRHELATLGKIDNTTTNKFVCFTLEDKDRGLTSDMPIDVVKHIKVAGETAIPTGRYRIIKAFSPHHQRIMPLLLDVHGFQGIEMHGGNTVVDTLGCILCAHTQDVDHDRIQGVAEKDIMDILNQAEIDLAEVWITVK